MTATAREMRHRLTRFHHASEPRDDPRVMGVPAWLVLFEVPLAGDRYQGMHLPGSTTRQRIDAVAVGLWSKKTEHEIRGYEIKVSRSDLLAELRDPGKAAAGYAVCDSWWLALSDPGLLKDTDELPAGWGVLACHGSGMRIVQPAERREGSKTPQFVAGLLQAGVRSSSWRRAGGFQAGYRVAQRAYEAELKRTRAMYQTEWLQRQDDAREVST